MAVASPDFIARHKTDELVARASSKSTKQQALLSDALSQVPCLVFDQDDQLQHDFLKHYCNAQPEFVHFCPSSDGFKQACLADRKPTARSLARACA